MDTRAELEQSYEQIDDRFSVLVEGSRSLIAFVSLGGELLYLNPAGRGILGFEPTVGSRIGDLLWEGDEEWERTILPRMLAFGEWHGEQSFRNFSSGAEVPLELDALVIRSESGTPAEIVLEARDLTVQKSAERERRELQMQLHRAIKMEAVGRLAGGIAHDFNNLLTAVAGFSEILLDHLEAGHPLREGAEQTLKTCRRSAEIIHRLLALSRRQSLQPVVLDLNRQVQETVKLLRSLIGEDVLVTTLLSAEPLSVRVDPAQMEQVLLNLLVNARDAMPGGGRLIVSTAGIEPEDACGMPGARIQVTDTGQGMDSETLAHLFEPFFTTKEKGSGLGLATVYGIVTQSGGSIHVESVPGEGTTFSIELPCVAARELGAPGMASVSVAAPSRPADETILVVEDDNVVRLVVRETLRRAGYRVLEAREGEAALEVVAGHEGSIQLLLSDVVMPGMDGPSLAERVSSTHPGLKTLYMSGHDEDAIHRHGIPADARCLEKPFTRERLIQSIRETLDS